MVNFQRAREIGGLVIDWDQDDFATSYEIEFSDDGKEWDTAYSAANSNGGRDYVYLQEAEAKFLRLNLKRASRSKGFAFRRVDIKGPEFSASPNAFFTAIAAEAPGGHYPKYLSNQQSYWTIVGAMVGELPGGGTRTETLSRNDRGERWRS